MDFVALDVETANADMSSICQIGLARYESSLLIEEWKTYIDPEDSFDDVNISIHGIDESTVEGAPTFAEIAPRLSNYIDSRIAVCHTHFDRVSIRQASAKYGLCAPACVWLDSARVTRRTWPQFAYSGYGLANVCSALKYEYLQHDALEDAKAAAHVLLAAMKETGLDLQGWLERVETPISGSTNSGNVARDGNPEGALHGEVIVFTGALNMLRQEAANLAAKIGCTVADNVTAKTTILVVGDQDFSKLAGYEKSTKQRKAEDLIRKGKSLRILQEKDFEALVSSFSQNSI